MARFDLRQNRPLHQRLSLTACAVLVAAMFAIDLSTPLGYADGVIYLVTIPLAFWLPGRYAPLVLASITAALTLTGFMFSAPGVAPTGMVVANRLVAVLAISVTAVVVFLYRTRWEKLHASEERFAHAVTGTTDGLWDWPDVNKEEEYWSPRFYEILGYSPGEISPTISNFRDLVHPDDRAASERNIKTHLSSYDTFSVDYRLRHGSGEYRWYRDRGKVVRDKDGKAVRMVGFLTDLSAIMSAQQALRDAREAAEKADRAKTRFLAAASHDLRQPLFSMRLLIDSLADATDIEQRRLIIDDIVASQTGMENMLNSLLDISKLDAGSVSPDIAYFPVQHLLDGLAGEARRYAEDIGVTFRCVPCGAIIESDQTLLRSIVQNFLTNALRYTSRGKVLLGCRRRGNALRVEVWDTGRGIPEDKHDTIFEEFYQAHNPTRDRTLGLGLGLAIAKRMADLLDHRIHMHSAPGKGSMFAVDVPLGALDAEQLESDANEPSVDMPGVAGRQILIVEDDRQVARALGRRIGEWGYSVAHAASGQAAETL
ncbi:MAG: PAS domain-containing protein, partial [Minwuiales bacterium]|nr:PAS domain-containing protein [Minwuiales bacterium]